MKVLRARLYDVKLKEQQDKLSQIGWEKKEIAFGSQIRSYVLHPYQMVKDHRTKVEIGNVDRVLDGDLDGFIKSYLMQKTTKNRSWFGLVVEVVIDGQIQNSDLCGGMIWVWISFSDHAGVWIKTKAHSIEGDGVNR